MNDQLHPNVFLEHKISNLKHRIDNMKKEIEEMEKELKIEQEVLDRRKKSGD